MVDSGAVLVKPGHSVIIRVNVYDAAKGDRLVLRVKGLPQTLDIPIAPQPRPPVQPLDPPKTGSSLAVPQWRTHAGAASLAFAQR